MYPPTLHYSASNPQINFDNTPFYVNTEMVKFRDLNIKVLGGVSSFGDGGTNVHVVLEEYRNNINTQNEDSSWYLVKLSARTVKSLEVMLEDICLFFEENDTVNFADAVYTLNTGRKDFEKRFYVTCSDSQDFVRKVRSSKDLSNENTLIDQNIRGASFIFAPVGLEWITTYNHVLYSMLNGYREELDKCMGLVMSTCFELSMVNLVNDIFKEGDNRKSFDNVKTMEKGLIDFIFQYSFSKLLIRLGVNPVALTGIGIGIFVAGCIMEVFDIEDVIAILSPSIDTGDYISCKLKSMVNNPNNNYANVSLISALTGTIVSNDTFMNPDFWISHLNQSENVNSSVVESMKKLGSMVISFNCINNTSCNKDVINSDFIVNPFNRNRSLFEKTFLEALGELWKYGVPVEWNEFYSTKEYYKVSLPVYPFEKLAIEIIS
ncbi:MAG: ketoacyl-synthetase C-terminal extension domain-containing protein [Bacillota bacterium]